MFILDSIGFGSAFALLIPLSYTPDVAFEISGAWFAAPSVIIMFYFLNIFGQFISSSNKLKPFIDKKKTTYAERKKLGISITKRLVNEKSFLSVFQDLFNASKKKDDLADCFLQGIWYLKNTILK